MLGSGIMDEADFDLPAAVLRRVSAHTYTCVWLCAGECLCVLCACIVCMYCVRVGTWFLYLVPLVSPMSYMSLPCTSFLSPLSSPLSSYVCTRM